MKHDIQSFAFGKLYNLIDVFRVWKLRLLKYSSTHNCSRTLPVDKHQGLQAGVHFSCIASVVESFLILLFNQSHSDFTASFFAIQF